MKFAAFWPFVLKRTHARIQTENYTLRDALREANDELRRHRKLIAGLRAGQVNVTQAIERVFSKPRAS